MYILPSLTIAPHSGVGGWTPNPRKLNPAAVNMEAAVRKVVKTTMGAKELGKICRIKIRTLLAPSAWLAST
jgi:hypothetical protein